MSSFITQSVEGNYPPYGENRLTQIAAASFNQSSVFRSCLLRFLGVKNSIKLEQVRALTQRPVWRGKERGQLDLEIIRGRCVIAIVENKVDAPLLPKQLRRYSGATRLKSSRKVALVRSQTSPKSVAKGWAIRHWRDFYTLLRSRLERQRSLPPVDEFVLRNFAGYLESTNMHTPIRISKGEMKKLAALLHGLRYAERTKFKWLPTSSDTFETAANWTRMMEAIWDEARMVSPIRHAAKKNFRFSPNVSHWSAGEGKKKDYPWIALHWELWLSKPRKKTKALGLGFFVDEKGKWTVEVYRHLDGEYEIDTRKVADGREDVVLSRISRLVMRKWQKWLV